MDKQYEPYQIAYATRHNLPVELIGEYEKLELAAYLEHMIRSYVMTVTHARKKFVENYPESNCLPVPKYVYDRVNNTYEIVRSEEMKSVLWLIQPFDDSIWEIPQI
jgi:hypothetical protein